MKPLITTAATRMNIVFIFSERQHDKDEYTRMDYARHVLPCAPPKGSGGWFPLSFKKKKKKKESPSHTSLSCTFYHELIICAEQYYR